MNNNLRRLCAGTIGLSLGWAGLTGAATLDSVYLFSSWSSPSNNTAAPFSFVGTSGYQLSLTGTLATGATLLSSDVTFGVDSALTYAAHTGTIDGGGGNAGYYSNEVATWDDAGIIAEGSTDAPKNIDYGDNAAVWFNALQPVGEGYYGLLIVEDAGLDPFLLSISSSTASVGQEIFRGFDSSVLSILYGSGWFTSRDTSNASNQDQAFLFLFKDFIGDAYVRIQETVNLNCCSERLEIDFVGAAYASTPAEVPIPGALPLFLSGLAGVGLLARRRKR
jgi:hypothetical protein